jgi:HIV Tat-specific factor 1
MNGRFFAGRMIEASLYTGKQRFKRGNAGEDLLEGNDEDAEKKRLDQFAQWLMTEGD